MFNVQKITEMTTYLLSKCGNTEYHLKLMKLLYLAERKNYERYGNPMVDDKLVSMKYGPVLSNTLDLINGNEYSEIWDANIEAINNHRLMLRHNTLPEFKSLTKSDRDILDSIWEEFGRMDRFTLCEWTHKHCPEWTDPKGSVLPIEEDKLLKALGYSDEDIQAIKEEKAADDNFIGVLESL